MDALESIGGGVYRLDELRERVLLVFAHSECPTSRLALGRLGPLGPALAERGVRLVCVVQEPLETAARMARQQGIEALVLAERPPYEAARAFAVETVPTTILLASDGAVEG
ncbi:MAG TPA: redoxin domain-containing protein, partial [Gaiellaceae bacterium]|nr:redoxin domain-containing protein [Gaiellaceae bacterium]